MRTRVLLSIKPDFAEKIFLGTKLYEFRRVLFKRKDIKTVIVYASSPVRQVIGEFEIDEVISLDKSDLWEIAEQYAGIDKEFFDSYFEGKSSANAIKIKNAKKYREPKKLDDWLGVKRPPQSFAYV